MSASAELPHPILSLVRRVHTEPVGLLADELGRFVLVGESEDDDPEGWSFATSSVVIPAAAEEVAVGFDFERGIVHPVRKQSTTFADTVLLGRSRSNDIRVDHTSVSKLHARIRLKSESFELEDAGSRNGTWHDSTRVENGAVEVFAGDTVRFGSRRFIVHATSRLLELLERVDPE